MVKTLHESNPYLLIFFFCNHLILRKIRLYSSFAVIERSFDDGEYGIYGIAGDIICAGMNVFIRIGSTFALS